MKKNTYEWFLKRRLREWEEVCGYVKQGAKKSNKDLSKIPIVKKEEL